MSRRYVDLTDAKASSRKFYNFRSWITQPGNQGYKLRSGTKRRRNVNRGLQTSVKELSKVVQGYELAGEVKFIKQEKFIPSKKGNWNQNRLPCPKCNIVICKLPGWSCQNICCRNCLHSFCWECGESLAVKDFRPCSKPGFYLAQLSKAGAGRRGNRLSRAGADRRGTLKIVKKVLQKCTFCGLRFRSLSGLRTHTRRHIMCLICSKRFSTKMKLTLHVKEHSKKGYFKRYEDPAAARRAILRYVETPAVVKNRIHPVRARKILFPTKKKRGRPRKKLFPAKRKNFLP